MGATMPYQVNIQSAPYKAMDIACWFINRNNIDYNNAEDEKMTLLKLLKLLYYAEGCHLALGMGSLFNEKILAWEHGPVVAEVWHEFPDAYNLYVSPEKMESSLSKIVRQDNDVLGNVYDVFGQYTAIGLRNKTHEEAPWLEATDGGKHLNGEISRETMKRYFEENYVETD